MSGRHRDRSPVALLDRALDDSVDQLVEQVDRIRAGDDPEPVHRARVATRRLRSDLHTFGPLLDDRRATRLRDRLRGVGELLGTVRDDDVLLERLRLRASELPDADGAAVGRLLRGLGRERDAARAALIDALDGAPFRELVAELRAVGADADPDAERDVRRLARRPWKKLRRAVRALADEPSDDELHEVRKRAKHARYAAEAIRPVAPGRTGRLARRLRDLQDTLGAHHDAVVADAWLRAASDGTGDPAVAFVAGELAFAFAADAARARRDWRRTWRRARRAADDVF